MAELDNANLEFDSYKYNLLKRGHDFGMEVDNGMSVFGKVLKYVDVNDIVISRYATLATRTSQVVYGAAGATSWVTWTDANNREYLREKESDYIMQAHIGIWPRQMRWWKQWPSGNTQGNLSEITVDTPALITTGGFIDGIESDYREPSRRSEILIPRELPIRHMIFNPTRVTIQPYFKLKIRRCYVYWYDPNISKDKEMIDGFARFIVRNNGKPVHYWSPGLGTFTWGSKQNINIEPVDIMKCAGGF